MLFRFNRILKTSHVRVGNGLSTIAKQKNLQNLGYLSAQIYLPVNPFYNPLIWIEFKYYLSLVGGLPSPDRRSVFADTLLDWVLHPRRSRNGRKPGGEKMNENKLKIQDIL